MPGLRLDGTHGALTALRILGITEGLQPGSQVGHIHGLRSQHLPPSSMPEAELPKQQKQGYTDPAHHPTHLKRTLPLQRPGSESLRFSRL